MTEITEKPEVENQFVDKAVSPEKGRNVSLTLKFIPHGERSPQTTLPSGEITGGTLTDYGRDVTQQKDHESNVDVGHIDAL